jgi:hypothetical protein
LLEGTSRWTNQSRRRQIRDRETTQTNDDRAGHAVESLWCAANLTNEIHRCRLHFQALSSLHPPRHRFVRRLYRSAPLPYLIQPLNKLGLPTPAVNLYLFANLSEFLAGIPTRRAKGERRFRTGYRRMSRIDQLFSSRECGLVRELNSISGKPDDHRWRVSCALRALPIDLIAAMERVIGSANESRCRVW